MRPLEAIKVLDLSRILAGKVRLDLQQVSMPEIVQRAIDSSMPAAEAKDIRVRSLLDAPAA